MPTETITIDLRKLPSGRRVNRYNIIFSFFAVPPPQNYILDHSKVNVYNTYASTFTGKIQKKRTKNDGSHAVIVIIVGGKPLITTNSGPVV